MIYLDIHEPISIKIELEGKGFTVKRQKLNIGDIRFGEYTIERKTVGDFMQSIYKRRMYDQLYNLQQAEKPVLIIVGEIPPKTQWMRMGRKKIQRALSYDEQMSRYNIIRNNMILAYTSFNVQAFHALDEDDFIEHVVALYLNSTKKGEKLRPLKRKSKSIKNIKIDILGCIPNIGSKMATDLGKKYSIRKIFNMSEKQLCKIDGIGKKTARKVMECVTK